VSAKGLNAANGTVGESGAHNATTSPTGSEADATLKDMIAAVDRHIAGYLPRRLGSDVIRRFAGDPTGIYHTEAGSAALSDPVWALLDRKGKRWRPVFGMLMIGVLGGDPAEYADLMSICGELSHTGSLIIDDIEDASELRRNAPCIHRLFGEPVAINAANTLYFLPLLHVLDRPGLTEAQRSGIVDVMIRAIIRGHIGQGLDIHWSRHLSRQNLATWMTHDLPAEVLQVYRNKTGALLMGIAEIAAILAGANDRLRRIVADFAADFSVAFQVMDDIHNYGNSSLWTKTSGEDIAEGKLTYVVVTALKRLESAERDRLIGILSDPVERITAETHGEAMDLIRSSGAIDESRALAQRLASEAWARLLPEVPMTPSLALLQHLATRLIQLDYSGKFSAETSGS
jgi:geranylgeranyl pyrophosphate synthase